MRNLRPLIIIIHGGFYFHKNPYGSSSVSKGTMDVKRALLRKLLRYLKNYPPKEGHRRLSHREEVLSACRFFEFFLLSFPFPVWSPFCSKNSSRDPYVNVLCPSQPGPWLAFCLQQNLLLHTFSPRDLAPFLDKY